MREGVKRETRRMSGIDGEREGGAGKRRRKQEEEEEEERGRKKRKKGLGGPTGEGKLIRSVVRLLMDLFEEEIRQTENNKRVREKMRVGVCVFFFFIVLFI